MIDHRDICAESRTLTLQAAVFRALRGHGLEPELSDTSGKSVHPAATFEEQLFRIVVAGDIVTSLRTTIGLDELERNWVHAVVDAACRRHERQRQRQPTAVAATTGTTATVVFRRRA